VGFHASPGESIGLIGLNGSGKSTLLKIVSRVMYPYAGHVEAEGRIGALIEVRAGLHPELTGRENVFLYGSLLGLKRREVAQRFDEIVAFAEVEDAIERQIKFYSTGMQMRLGFAVAAFLEPDILLVDEVLAVGDATFQQKCLSRMRTVLSQGTTLVYVSHDLSTVEATCSRGLWLRDGVVGADGRVGDVLDAYRRFYEGLDGFEHPDTTAMRLVKAETHGPSGNGIRTNEPIEVRFVLRNAASRSVNLHLGVTAGTANPIFAVERTTHLEEGETAIRCVLSSLPLPRGRFTLWFGVTGDGNQDILPWHRATSFDVIGPTLDPTPRGVVRAAPIHVDAAWELSREA
jgi:ABC-2 type transport system ATP-binding protein